MAYAKPLRTARLSLADAGEPDHWVEVEHPETLRWKTKRAIMQAQNEADEATRSVRQVLAMVVSWSLTREDGTAMPIPPTDDDLDAMPSHVVEGLLLAIGALFDVPKANGSASTDG